jgi:hypothetical protein
MGDDRPVGGAAESGLGDAADGRDRPRRCRSGQEAAPCESAFSERGGRFCARLLCRLRKLVRGARSPAWSELAFTDLAFPRDRPIMAPRSAKAALGAANRRPAGLNARWRAGAYGDGHRASAVESRGGSCPRRLTETRHLCDSCVKALAQARRDFETASAELFFEPEVIMAKPNLSRMDVASLMALRRRVDARIMQHRAELQKQLDALDDAHGISRGLGAPPLPCWEFLRDNFFGAPRIAFGLLTEHQPLARQRFVLVGQFRTIQVS